MLGTPRPLTVLDLLLALVVGSTTLAVGATAGPLGAAVGLVAAVGFVLGLSRPPLLGLAVVAIVPVTSGIARDVPVPGLRVSEVVVVAAALVTLTRTAGRRERRWEALDWAAVAFVGLHVALGLFDGLLYGSVRGDGVSVLLGPVQFFLLYRVVRATIETPAQRRLAVLVLLLATVPVSLLAIAQYAGVGPVQRFIEELTRSGVFELWGYERLPRATGPFESWHPLAGYLFLPMSLAVALLAQGGRSVVRPVITAATLTLMVGALLVSLTLNVMAGFAAVVVLVAILTRRYLRVLLPLVLVVLVGVAVFGPVLLGRLDNTDPTSGSLAAPQTIGYRFEVWTEQYLPALEPYWLTGYGPELPPDIEWRSTESVYFTLLFRGGVLLLVAYLVLWGVAMARAWRARRARDPAQRAIAVALVASAIALVPMQAVFPYFTASGLPQVWWVLVALVAGSSLRGEPRRGAPRPSPG